MTPLSSIKKDVKLLCQPITPFQKLPNVFEQDFIKEGYNISIRPFCITTDLGFITQWVKHDYSTKWHQLEISARELLETFKLIAESSYAQSYTGIVDTTLLWLVEIYQAAKYETQFYKSAGDHDYVISLLFSHLIQIPDSLFVNIVLCYLTYFFEFEGIKNIYTEVPVENLKRNKQIKKAGFEFAKAIDYLHYKTNLYRYSRGRFEKRGL